jgi:membrane associated rhomboid family serine protease
VFLYMVALGERRVDLIYSHAVIPYRFLTLFGEDPSESLTLFTAMFLHGGWFHVIGNLLYLYIFGDNVEDVLGHGRFLVFYLLCGLISFLVQIFLHPQSMVPNIGASGAIAGVLGAYLILFPRARIVTLLPLFIFITVVEIPAFFFLGIWFLIQFLSGAATLGRTAATSGGVAWWAHIGGFISGIILLMVFIPKGRLRRRSSGFDPP